MWYEKCHVQNTVIETHLLSFPIVGTTSSRCNRITLCKCRWSWNQSDEMYSMWTLRTQSDRKVHTSTEEIGLPSFSYILTLGRAWQDASIARDNMIAKFVEQMGMQMIYQATKCGKEKKVCKIYWGIK